MLDRRFFRILLSCSSVMFAAPTIGAEVTPGRLTSPEPGNWLNRLHGWRPCRL
jgi:hypothetical protein